MSSTTSAFHLLSFRVPHKSASLHVRKWRLALFYGDPHRLPKPRATRMHLNGACGPLANTSSPRNDHLVPEITGISITTSMPSKAQMLFPDCSRASSPPVLPLLAPGGKSFAYPAFWWIITPQDPRFGLLALHANLFWIFPWHARVVAAHALFTSF